MVLVDRIGEHEGRGVAELLAERARCVWLVTPFDLVAPYVNYVSRIGVLRRLGARRVTLVTGSELEHARGVVVRDLYTGHRARLRDIDAVVLAGSNRAESGLLEPLRAAVPEVHAIGDCYAPRTATSATHEGHRIGRCV